jgi:uncharacterized membrane protein YhhN
MLDIPLVVRYRTMSGKAPADFLRSRQASKEKNSKDIADNCQEKSSRKGGAMISTAVLLVAFVLLGAVLYFEKTESRAGLVTTKACLSLLFILAALVQKDPLSPYCAFVVGGLVFCLGGDVFLALPQKKSFVVGLACFLVGHLFYVIGFFSTAGFSGWTWVSLVLAAASSALVYRWLRSHLGKMKGPVIGYMVVITVMVCGASSVLGVPDFNLTGRVMVFSGALAFYFSDVFVARDRFVKAEFLNRLVGLPMYYVGQFLIAFSLGFLRAA